MEKMRDATFDMLKGIGILLVIIGHTFMKEIGPYIQAFHMPLFFIVAGYFFKYKPVKDRFIRDFRRLIIPYLFVVIMTALIAFAKDLKETGEIDLHLDSLYECGTPAWFLLALFVAKQIFNLLFQFSKRFYLLYAFLLSSTPCIMAHYIEIDPTLAIGSSVCAVFFYAVGYYVNTNHILIKSAPYKAYIVVMAILLWLNTSIFGAVDMHYCIFKLWIIDFLGACAGVYLCYALCNYIEKRTVLAKNLLIAIGYYSFVIYSFHAIEYVFPDWHQIASFSDGTALRPFVILAFRLLGTYFFIQITVNVMMLKELFFPKHHVY